MSWNELHPFIQEAGRTSLAVGFLVLLVLVIRKPFARRFGAKAAYLLWALPLARFVTPPLPGNWSLSGLLGFNRVPAEAFREEISPGALEDINVWTDETREIAFAAVPPEAATDPAAVMASALPSAPQTTSLPEAILAQAPLILTSVWLAGMVLWLGRSLYQQHVFRGLIEDDSQPAAEETQTQAMRIARQLSLKRMPEVRASLLCSGPLVTGLTKPVVLLPLWFEEDYSEAERRDALVHEMMHLKRRDLWAFQIARIIAATQWFNPLAHIALSAFRTDQEAACDADVITRARLSPADYGRTLVKAARLARPSDRRIAAASLTLAHPIKERLIMMMHPTPSLRSRLLGGSLAIALGAGAVFATASSIAQELDGAADETDSSIVLEDIHDMSFSMTIDGETFSFDMGDLPPMPPIPALPDLPPVPGLILEQDGNHFHMSFDSEDFEMDEAALAEWEIKMEAWGEQMESWGEVVEARAEEWAITMEPHLEAWAEGHADALADQIEMMVEQAELSAEQAEAYAELVEEHADRHGDTYKGVTKAETREFDAKPFDKIELGSGLSLVYTQDPKASITAKLERGSWDQVDVSVKNETLIVKRKGKGSWSRGPKLTVYATSKELKEIDAASGSSFKGSVIANDLKVDASSGSSLSLEGACSNLDLDASSGSSVQFAKLECQTANIDASSGSSIRAYASTAVDVDASSGSSIRVDGSPKTVKKDTSSGASVSIK